MAVGASGGGSAKAPCSGRTLESSRVVPGPSVASAAAVRSALVTASWLASVCLSLPRRRTCRETPPPLPVRVMGAGVAAAAPAARAAPVGGRPGVTSGLTVRAGAGDVLCGRARGKVGRARGRGGAMGRRVTSPVGLRRVATRHAGPPRARGGRGPGCVANGAVYARGGGTILSVGCAVAAPTTTRAPRSTRAPSPVW